MAREKKNSRERRKERSTRLNVGVVDGGGQPLAHAYIPRCYITLSRRANSPLTFLLSFLPACPRPFVPPPLRDEATARLAIYVHAPSRYIWRSEDHLVADTKPNVGQRTRITINSRWVRWVGWVGGKVDCETEKGRHILTSSHDREPLGRPQLSSEIDLRLFLPCRVTSISI